MRRFPVYRPSRRLCRIAVSGGLLPLLALLLLSGCGQRGDLTLPEPKPDESEEQTAG